MLKIFEQVPSGKKGFEIYVQFSDRSQAEEWLLTNGFIHAVVPSGPGCWTRDGGTTITSREGTVAALLGTTRCSLRADFLTTHQILDVICESVGEG